MSFTTTTPGEEKKSLNEITKKDSALKLFSDVREVISELSIELRKARIASGMSIKDVSEASGLSPRTVKKIETLCPDSDPRLENIIKYATVVGMDFDITCKGKDKKQIAVKTKKQSK